MTDRKGLYYNYLIHSHGEKVVIYAQLEIYRRVSHFFVAGANFLVANVNRHMDFIAKTFVKLPPLRFSNAKIYF